MKIAYEPHPVSPERKAELRKQGFKILDAKFAPPEVRAPEGKVADPAGQARDLPTADDIAKMPKAELVEWLKAHGVDAPEGKVAELREVLTKIMFVDGDGLAAVQDGAPAAPEA